MKTYKIEIDEVKNTITRVNDGFNSFELIGLLTITLKSIKRQAQGDENSPEIIKKFIKTENKTNE